VKTESVREIKELHENIGRAGNKDGNKSLQNVK
jgi:hypothetical protein